MNQTPGNPYDQPGTAPPGSDDAASNPYMNARSAQAAPDLDAAAPSLRTAEQQRINRKALLFLGGIVLLLMLLAAVVFRSATRDEDVPKPLEEQVSIPTLNDTGTPSLPSDPSLGAEPIALQPTDDELLSPPLPEPTLSATDPGAPTGFESEDTGPRPPSLMERRMGSASGQGGGEMGPDTVGGMTQDDYVQQRMAQLGVAPDAAAPTGNDRRSRPTSAQYLQKPDTLLLRGTYLRCVLETRIITDIPGYTSCIVTEPVYSVNGKSMLLPRGSKIYGSYDEEPSGPRIAVVWDRITTPTGLDVNMASPGIDNLGGAGHPGHYSAHWPSRITSALLISLLSDAFKYAAAENGPRTTTVQSGVITDTPFESNTARTMERLANEAVSKSMRRPATVTINQGTVVTVYVAKDVDFSNVVARR